MSAQAQPPCPRPPLGSAEQANLAELAQALEPVVELVRSGRLDANTLAAGVLRLAGRSTPELVDAAEVAVRYGVTAAWVRENGARLGGVGLGTGKRPRWRFDPQRVAEAMTALPENVRSRRAESAASVPKRRARPQRPTGTGTDLLPIRGERPCP